MTKKLISLVGLLALSANIAYAGSWKTYSVTVTNGSLNHYLTPPLVVAHKADFKVFTLGTEATDALATQAESGDPSLLKAEVEASDEVYATAVGDGVIPPGTSATITIKAPRHAVFSLTSMLAGSNDALVTLSGVKSPRHMGMYHTMVIDAGSEANNELCAYVPGPPCAMDSGNMHEDGEGMIHYHTGYHGGGDLNPAEMDWRDAIATVTIKRMH